MFLQIVQSQAYMLVQLVIQCLYNGKNWRVTNIVWYNLMRAFIPFVPVHKRVWSVATSTRYELSSCLR